MSTPLRFDRLTIADKLYYERVKKVLDKSKHPGFLGREVVFRCAERGVVIVAALDDQDVGVVLVDHKHTLGTLSVIPGARKHGVGGALVREARPFARFVKAIADRVGYFERLGYRPCGAPTIGAAGKMLTQLMERVDDDAFHAEGAPIVVSLSPIEPELKSETATDRRKREDAERRDAKEAKTNRLRELSLLNLSPNSRHTTGRPSTYAHGARSSSEHRPTPSGQCARSPSVITKRKRRYTGSSTCC